MPSVGPVGDAYDNAMAESVVATLERELLSRYCFKSQVDAKMAVFEMDRRVLQPSPQTLRTRLSLSSQLRARASMTLTSEDLHGFAARIRAYFNPPLQDIAEEFALLIARTAGVRAKELRPETTLDQILEWIGTESLNRVEVIMAIEAELGFEIPDEDADSAVTTFRQLVTRIAQKRGAL